MKKNPDAALRRDEKIQKKHQKQAKIMTVICIVVAALVAALAVWWLITGIRNSIKNKPLPPGEMQALFESNEHIPAEDSPIIGSWYFYYDDTIVGKYQFNSDGKLLVFDWTEQGYNIKSLTDYRVRENAKKLYVKPDGENKIVEYDYTLEPLKDKENVYMMRWTYEDQTWTLIKIVEE